MKVDKALYFVALVPDNPLKQHITDIKELFRDEYNSKAALRSPPHITLLMPFKWRVDREQFLSESLSRTAQNQKVFNITLNGYGAFPPRVIYVNPEPSPELLELKKSINSMALRDWKLTDLLDDRPFHPHMTVAFRDLRKSEFHRAWEKFKDKNFSGAFEANNLSLLKHNGKYWEIAEQFYFKKRNSGSE